MFKIIVGTTIAALFYNSIRAFDTWSRNDYLDPIDQRDDLKKYNRRLWVLLIVLFALPLFGCTSFSAGVEHVSHPSAGPPFGPRSEEDSINQALTCGKHERYGWYAELCLGYQLTDGGFYGPRVTTSARIMKNIKVSR